MVAVPILSRLALVALLGALSGCATQSGQALADWMGNSLGRLRHAVDPDRWVTPEIQRARNLLATAPGYPAGELRRTRTLAQSTSRQVTDVWERTERLPGCVVATVNQNVTDMKRRVAEVLAPDSLLHRTLDPGRQVAAVRRIYRELPTVLGLDRQILPGPGDPDRQTVAHPTGPTETWVQKILRRVRL